MEKSQISAIKAKINIKAKRIYLALLIMFSLIIIVINFFAYLNIKNVLESSKIELSMNNEIDPLMFLFVIILPSLLSIIYFTLSVFVFKKNNYNCFRNTILHEWINRKRIPGQSHVFKSLLKSIFSISFTFAFIASTFIFFYFTYNNNLILRTIGFFVSYFSFITMFLYIFIALPRMLALKTKNNTEIYFYWLHFFKSLFVNSPVFIFISFGLYVVVSLALTVFTWLVYADNSENSIFAIFDLNKLGISLSIVGIWLSSAIAFANDVLRAYSRLEKCYEDYTSYTLRNHIINHNQFDFILIGMGNLGRITAGFLIPEKLKLQCKDDELLTPYKHFECFIDRSFKMRIFPRDIIGIETNTSLFEEIRVDSSSGLSYGFLSGKDIISDLSKDLRLPADLAIFCLNGDGGYLPMLSLAKFERSKFIINTSSDQDMGLNLRNILKREEVNLQLTNDTYLQNNQEKPVIISTVEDSSIYAYLEKSDNQTFYPLHAALIEGNSVGTRLFMIFRNITENNTDIKNIRLFVVGNGKTLYYLIEVLYNLVSKFYSESIADNLLANQLIVICNDYPLTEELIPVQTSTRKKNAFPNRNYWLTWMKKKKLHRIAVVNQTPSGYVPLVNAFEWSVERGGFKPSNEFENIIVYSTKNQNDALRMCEHIKQIINEKELSRVGVLASVTIEIESEVLKSLQSIHEVTEFLSIHRGFPSNVSDIIIKKNLIIASQILSISDCLTYNKQQNNHKATKIETGELAICLDDKPLSISLLLQKISGLIGFIPLKEGAMIPSFYYNYTYTYRTNKIQGTNCFIFRGDACFSNYKKDNRHNHGYVLNGTERFINYADKFLANIFDEKDRDEPCGYFSKCPISNGCSTNEMCINNDNYSEFATIKILADEDNKIGSLALTISDFLMIGKHLQFSDSKPLNKNVDIIYENCILCSNNSRSINRWYIKINDQSLDEESANRKLLEHRNIIGIKIKPSNKNSKKWMSYSKRLLIYLNEFNHSFILTKSPEEEYIFFNQLHSEYREIVFNEL